MNKTALLLAAGLGLAASSEPARAAQQAPVLVELFTSQGCSSCPPADTVLGELAARPDVVALAFHVTYWDRLGWKDTLGNERWTDRQRGYARLLGSSSVYTPQMVIAGQIDVVGSSRSRVLRAVDLVRAEGKTQPLAIDAEGGLSLPATAAPAHVWAAAYDESETVAIGSGENGGRTLDYHHVVRELLDLGPAGNAPQRLELPLAAMKAKGRAGIVVVAQRDSDGAILALGQRAL
jgi:hypothetical protein